MAARMAGTEGWVALTANKPGTVLSQFGQPHVAVEVTFPHVICTESRNCVPEATKTKVCVRRRHVLLQCPTRTCPNHPQAGFHLQEADWANPQPALLAHKRQLSQVCQCLQTKCGKPPKNFPKHIQFNPGADCHAPSSVQPPQEGCLLCRELGCSLKPCADTWGFLTLQ